MNDNVLEFTLNILRANNINTHVLPEEKMLDTISFDLGLRKGILNVAIKNEEIITGLDTIPAKTILHITDAFGCLYTILPLPSNNLLFLGPVMEMENWESLCQQISFERNLSPEIQEQLQDYYHRIPKLSMINGYHSIIFELGKYYYEKELMIRYIQSEYTRDFDSGSTASPLSFMEQPVLSMKMMEERYELENRLLEAIHHGNEMLAMQALQHFRGITVPFLDEKNVPLSVQYRLVGLNSTFRKEVEQVDVHPLYIEKVSTQILLQIQKIQSDQACQKLVIDMIKQYCNLVKKYSLTGYSPVIRNVIHYARIHLNKDLSLRSLAERFNINRTYLSTLFHQEIGTTLTDYINGLRIEYAAELLRNNHFSIADASAEVGFSDVSYFTRVFKKVMGRTPAQYIKNSKNK